MRRTIAAIATAAVAIGAASAGIAIAAGERDDDRALSRSTLERAKGAALEHVGGGTVVETEVGDDGAAYGVEIRRDDGSVVEVSLDERFDVIADEADDDGAGDRDDGKEDD